MKNKVLLLNCSTRKNGNCSTLLKIGQKKLCPELNVEHLNLSDYNILPCKGCLKCLMATKGCVINDDAIEIIKKILAADYLIMALPVYFLSANAILKLLLDRLLIVNTLSNYESKGQAGIIITSGRPGWEGVSLQLASIFLLSSGFRIKTAETFYAQGPAEILLEDNLETRVESFINTVLSNENTVSNLDTKCPICFTDNFIVKDKSTVTCSICDISGSIKGSIKNRALIEFNIDDINNHRWQPENLREHMSSWVADSIPRYKANIREIIKRKKNIPG